MSIVLCKTLIAPSLLQNTSKEIAGGFMVYHGFANVTRCTFVNNTATFGGGMLLRNAVVLVKDAKITGNKADSGGGLFVRPRV